MLVWLCEWAEVWDAFECECVCCGVLGNGGGDVVEWGELNGVVSGGG